MFDYTRLPTGSTEASIELFRVDNTTNYTFMENADEMKLYNNLNDRLTKLETSISVDQELLESIINDTKAFRFLKNDKDEINMRISWLERLDNVQRELANVQTKAQVEKLMKLMSVCQTSPLKSRLIIQLEEIIQSLPSEEREPVQMTDAEALMIQVFDEAGDAFINLGKTGREYIIVDVLKQFGKKVTLQHVQEHTAILEQRVLSLADVKGQAQLIEQLESLPIELFSILSNERKAEIAERLLEKKQWHGLATLERIILHWNRYFTDEEEKEQEVENAIQTSDGQAALTLDIKDIVDGRVQLG